MKPSVSIMLAGMLLWTAVALGQDAQPEAVGAGGLDQPSDHGNDLWSREKLTGNWGGVREGLSAAGLTIDFDATYTFQGVAAGGFDGPFFDLFSDEGDTGNTFSGDLMLGLDTAKAGLWRGGTFKVCVEGRAGRSVLQRAGSVSAVNNDALFPDVVDKFDDDVTAITELTYTQHLCDKVALFGGLLNTAEGDANEIAGSALSNTHFLNSAMLYSLVEDATTPNVSLGGGILFELSEDLSGSFSVFGTQETAGENPFDHTQGTTFSTEWTMGHKLLERPGAQTCGFLYGINGSRANIAANPRIVLLSILGTRRVLSRPERRGFAGGAQRGRRNRRGTLL